MKFLLICLIASITPFLIFSAVLLLQQNSNQTLKKQIKEYGVYSQLSSQLAKNDVTNADGGELYGNFVKKRFTEEYLQAKSEIAIDQSADWIIGKSQTPPTVNFKELKHDITKKLPLFMKALQNVPGTNEMESYGLDRQQQEEFLKQRASISFFVKNDFSFRLDDYLIGFKKVYASLKIIVPVLSIMLIAAVVMLVQLAKDLPAKCNWLGLACLLSAITGLLLVYSKDYIFDFFTTIFYADLSSYLAIITPILVGVLRYFMDSYIQIQNMINIILLISAAIFFISAIVTKHLIHTNKNIAPLLSK